MPTFLLVKEAAKRTGKSQSSIRRVIYPITRNDNHTNRHHIEPNAEEARKLRLKGENFAWRISEELLRREVPIEPAKPTGDQRGDSQPRTAGDVELLDMLRKELDIKNRQITEQSEMLSKQMELISGLTERLGEGNILIGSLQKQLALPDGSGHDEANFVDAKSATPPATEKGSDAAKKKAKSKKGIFARFFQ